MPSPTQVPINKIVSQGMGLQVHWYQDTVGIDVLAATLVGMANSKGGVVYIGISESTGEIIGIQNQEMVIDRIYQSALKVNPPLVLPIPQIGVVGVVEFVRIVVPDGLPNVYNLRGRYFGRRGNQTHPLTPKRLRELMIERGTIQFEQQIPPNATLDDLDPDQISDYVDILGNPERDSIEDLLLRRGCLINLKGVIRPTYTALLLFGKHPQQWLPSATILAAKFSGTSFSDTFLKQEIRGTLADQIQQAETFIRTHLRSTVRLVGLTHLERPEYPIEAIRELIINAVTHRDYNLQGDGIHINIFSDRLEIQSPGRLPGPVNLDNLLVSRFSRNAVTTQVLSDLGYVERLGYGLTRVINSLNQNGMPKPKFEEVGANFRVTLYNFLNERLLDHQPSDISKYKAYNLNSRQEMAIGYLLTHQRITNRTYQELSPEVSTETIRRDLVDLVGKGLLIKVGHKKATYYIFKSSPRDVKDIDATTNSRA